MDKELAIITIGYLIGYYKSHDETTINSDEIEAINFILKDNENLEQQVKNQQEVIDKVKKHCEIEINASNHYLQNHSSQQELCHKVAHQRILDILKEVSE